MKGNKNIFRTKQKQNEVTTYQNLQGSAKEVHRDKLTLNAYIRKVHKS